MNRKWSGEFFAMIFAVVLTAVASGCGTIQHTLVLEKDYQPKADAKVEIGKVSNEAGKTYDIAIEDMLRVALTDALSSVELLRSDLQKPALMTDCRILQYEKGDAFKRWLMPGWGSTILMVQCDLVDSGAKVGTIDAKRTVTAGGAYTIDAWKEIFNQLAFDVVSDIKEKITNNK